MRFGPPLAAPDVMDSDYAWEVEPSGRWTWAVRVDWGWRSIHLGPAFGRDRAIAKALRFIERDEALVHRREQRVTSRAHKTPQATTNQGASE